MRILTILLGFFLSALTGAAGEFTLLLCDNPPLVTLAEGKEPGGVCVDLVREIQKKAGTNFALRAEKYIPALTALEKSPDCALLPMAGDYALRRKFTLVGPIFTEEFCFFAAKDSELKVSTLEEAKAHRIGVVEKSVCHQFLLSLGFTNFFIADSETRLPQLLTEGRCELWLAGRLNAYHLARGQKVAPDAIKPLCVAFTSPVYVGFNQKVDTKILENWKTAIADLEKSSRLAAIVKEWTDKLAGAPKKSVPAK